MLSTVADTHSVTIPARLALLRSYPPSPGGGRVHPTLGLSCPEQENGSCSASLSPLVSTSFKVPASPLAPDRSEFSMALLATGTICEKSLFGRGGGHFILHMQRAAFELGTCVSLRTLHVRIALSSDLEETKLLQDGRIQNRLLWPDFPSRSMYIFGTSNVMVVFSMLRYILKSTKFQR